MRLRNENISSLRRFTGDERKALMDAWKKGTSVAGLRKLQMVVLLFVAVMATLRAFGNEEGIRLSAGIGTGVVVLLLCAPVLLHWNGQIRKIRRYQQLLEEGRFTLVPAQGEHAVFNRWNVYYVGFATVRLTDGTTGTHVPMPYQQAVRLQKSGEKFTGYVVAFEGENSCMFFPG